MNLIEPGATAASDTFEQTYTGGNSTFWQFASDPKTGLSLVTGGSVTENGMAQLVATVNYLGTSPPTDQIFVQSDLDTPEPSTVATVLMGFALLGVVMLRQRTASRPL